MGFLQKGRITFLASSASSLAKETSSVVFDVMVLGLCRLGGGGRRSVVGRRVGYWMLDGASS